MNLCVLGVLQCGVTERLSALVGLGLLGTDVLSLKPKADHFCTFDWGVEKSSLRFPIANFTMLHARGS